MDILPTEIFDDTRLMNRHGGIEFYIEIDTKNRTALETLSGLTKTPVFELYGYCANSKHFYVSIHKIFGICCYGSENDLEGLNTIKLSEFALWYKADEYLPKFLTCEKATWSDNAYRYYTDDPSKANWISDDEAVHKFYILNGNKYVPLRECNIDLSKPNYEKPIIIKPTELAKLIGYYYHDEDEWFDSTGLLSDLMENYTDTVKEN